MTSDPRLSSPSALRNRHAICRTLRLILPQKGLVLEIGAGTGEHCTLFAQKFPNLTFQPTECDASKIASIEAWRCKERLFNMREAQFFDVLQDARPVDQASALLAINVIHITPWKTSKALFKLANQLLAPHGPLIFYGPFHRSDQETAESNQMFDAQLQAQHPDFGLRHVDDLCVLAEANGFGSACLFDMPSNNLCVVFYRL